MDVSRLWAPVTRWGEFRRRQLEALEQSNHIAARAVEVDDVPVAAPAAATASTGSAGLTDSRDSTGSTDSPVDEMLLGSDAPEPHRSPPPGEGAGSIPTAPYGTVGRPLNRHSPFYIGFFGATGAMLAVGLWQLMGRLTTTLTVLVVAFFLTLALNPIVDRLVARGVRRAGAVAVVFGGAIVVFVLIGFLVIPPVVDQGAQLAQTAPTYAQDALNSRWVREIDKNYDVIDKVQAELTTKLSDQRFLEGLLGGLLGAGRAVLNGAFQFFTILVLTLYFLASLPRVKQAAYAMVPSTRRARFVSLSEEIMRRVGSYAIGQVSIATLNAILSFFMMSLVGIPYAAVLAVSVGLLGLIPMVGATLGAVLVCLVAFFDEPQKAVIAGVYYLVYQQLENYLVAPRIMQRTVSVPGPVTVVAALAGGALLGVLGALLAIPVAAGLLLLYEEVLVPRQRRA
ncbi:AI-2E family transporter [Oryzobacter terrae]|uniref:AI-2E family transporter n=1 Tax=Oryzobacter terrae TaxID=1620385 RepID=UPI00366B7D3A